MQVLKKQRKVGEDLAEGCWVIVSDRDKLQRVLSSLCLILIMLWAVHKLKEELVRNKIKTWISSPLLTHRLCVSLGKMLLCFFSSSQCLICKTEITPLLFSQPDYLHNKSLSMHDRLLYICTASRIMRTWILGLQHKQYTTIKIIHPSKIYLMHLILHYLARETWLYSTVNSVSLISAVPPLVLLFCLRKALVES